MENTIILLICMGILLLDIIIFLIFKICDMYKTNNQLKAEIAEIKKNPMSLLNLPECFCFEELKYISLTATYTVPRAEEVEIKSRTADGTYEAFILDQLSQNLAEQIVSQNLIKVHRHSNWENNGYEYKTRLTIGVNKYDTLQ